VRDVCSELEVGILKGHVGKDHVPRSSPARRMCRRAT
jgi:hypothetical protein